MRNLLALVGAAVVGFVAVGWLLGWYKVNTSTSPDGRRQVHIDLNAPKIKQDLDTGRKKVANALAQPTNPQVAPAPVPAGGQPTAMPGPATLPVPGDGSVTVRPATPAHDAQGSYFRYFGD